MKEKNKYIIFIFAISAFFGMWNGCMTNPEFTTDVKNAEKPEVGEISRWEQTASSITMTASVLNSNGYRVTERGFCWSTDEMPDTTDNKVLAAEERDNVFTAVIENLQSNTTYYIRPYAVNQAGINYGVQSKILTNSGLGEVRTVKPQNIHATTAICGGVIISPGEGTIRERGVYISRSADMTVDVKDFQSTMTTDSFVCNVTDLIPSTKYYVQAYVRNSNGTFRGKDPNPEFTTGDGRPKVDSVDVEPELIGYTEASLYSRIIDEGDAPFTLRGFYWSEMPIVDSASFADAKIVYARGIAMPFVGSLENLQPSTKYYVRAFATNKFGTGYSDRLTEFYTLSEMPAIRTLEPVSTTGGTVILTGQVLNQGKSNIISGGICYSSTVQSPTLLSGEHVSVMPGTSGMIRTELSGWKGKTTYYVVAYATNSEGTSYGEVKTFETPPIFGENLAAFPGTTLIQGSPAYFTIGNRGYLLGGDLGPEYTNDLWSYDVSANSWRHLQAHPKSAAKWQAAVSYNTDVYVLGGLGRDYEKKNDFYRYTSSNNMWYPMPVGPDSSYLRAGFLLENEICFVGGIKDTAKNEVWAFDVNLNGWSQKAEFPTQQYGGLAVNIDNTIYAGMGKGSLGVCNKTLWKSSDGLISWTEEPACTALHEGILAGVAYKNKIYVIDEEYYIFEYNPSTRQWNTKSRLAAKYQDIHCMYVMNDLIYIGLSLNMLFTYNPLWDN
ncbi:MAG: hypothetical protein LBT83_06825 [Tannerella sp.]|jgi:hypothetical protein|nr:hypothetical protein [Tannerella sp.]